MIRGKWVKGFYSRRLYAKKHPPGDAWPPGLMNRIMSNDCDRLRPVRRKLRMGQLFGCKRTGSVEERRGSKTEGVNRGARAEEKQKENGYMGI
jgi:hypothetical protein